jgi:hypothetical protein
MDFFYCNDSLPKQLTTNNNLVLLDLPAQLCGRLNTKHNPPKSSVHEFLQCATKEETVKACFQQDSTTCHTADVMTMCTFHLLFWDLFISEGLYPPPHPHSWQDLSPPGSFYVGLHHNNKCNVYEQKANTPDTHADIPTMMLQAVSMTMLHSTQLQMKSAGTCFQNFL